MHEEYQILAWSPDLYVSNQITVFTQISAAALISFFAPQVQRLFEGGAYLNIAPDKFTFSIFL